MPVLRPDVIQRETADVYIRRLPTLPPARCLIDCPRPTLRQRLAAATASLMKSRRGLTLADDLSRRRLELVMLRIVTGIGALGPRQSQQGADLFKGEPRQPWKELRWVSVAEIAQEVRLDMTCRDELLLAAVARCPGSEELLVHLGVVES